MLTGNTWRKVILVLAIISLNGCSLVPHISSNKNARTALTEGDYPRAVSALKAGKDEEALSLFNAVTRSYPDLAAAYINIGLIEIKKDHLHTAESALLHAAALAPEQPETYNGLGIIYRRLGRFNDSESAYLKALRFAPDYANAHLNLGILYEIYLNDLSAALPHYERYQAISSGSNDLVNKWIIDVKQRLARNMGAAK